MHVRPYVPAGSSPSLFSPFLTPDSTHSFILTVINPLYDPIRLTLSTTAETPGPCQHAVTILRPEFSVGANADIWNDEDEIIHSPEKEKRKSRFGIFEARKNTISIFMEIVPENPSSAAGNKKVDAVSEGEIPIEIPIFVKMTYLSEDMEKDDTLTLVNQVLGEGKGKGKVEREIGYWVVVKVGNIKAQ
jgi:Dynactin p62 family